MPAPQVIRRRPSATEVSTGMDLSVQHGAARSEAAAAAIMSVGVGRMELRFCMPMKTDWRLGNLAGLRAAWAAQ